MELEILREEGRARLRVKGTIDETGAENLKQKFREQKLSSLKEVIFDFHGVDYIGSAGIGKLLLFYKDMSLQNGKIRIENLTETVYDLLAALKLDTLFAISRA